MTTKGSGMDLPRENLVRLAPETAELRETSDGGMPTIFGHFARFNHWNEINSIFEGRFMERVAPGAFKKTFAENRDRFKILFQHGRDPVIGDKPLAPVRELREDDIGPYYEGPMLDTAYNRELLPGLQAGVYGASYRFNVLREEIVEEPGKSDHNPQGLPERTIKEARVMEGGPVTFPADVTATAGVRSLTDWYRSTPDFETSLTQLAREHPGELARLIQDALPATPEQPEALTPEASSEENREEEAPSTQATEPERREPSEAATNEEEREQMVNPNATPAEVEARQKEIAQRLADINAEVGMAPRNDTQMAEFRKLEAERDENAKALADYADRKRSLEKSEGTIAEEPGFIPSRFNTPKPQGDIYDLSTVRGAFDNPQIARHELRDRALHAIEDQRWPELGRVASEEDMQGRLSYLLRNVDSGGDLALRTLITGHPMYEEAFWKKLSGRELSGAEKAVFERAALLQATTGYAMPIALDPTVALTSSGVVNPLRDIARVVTITGNTWKGVNSAGITASYDAEGAEVSEDTPTLTQPTTTVLKAQAFVPYSMESEGWGDLRNEITLEFQDAKDTLEATQFALGTGSPQPQGVVPSSTNLATTAATATLALSDFDTLTDALPPRYQANASIVANRKIWGKVRALSRTAGASPEWAPQAVGVPNTFLGYPRYELSTMVGTTTSASLMAIVGDFRRFVIVDRVGMNVEYIPVLFHTTSNYPSGQRGLYAYWFNTSVNRDIAAFRVLKAL